MKSRGTHNPGDMKRLIVLSILALVLAYCYRAWLPALLKATAAAERDRQPPRARPIPSPTIAATTPPGAAPKLHSSSSSPLTDDYRRIFDAPDAMAIIDQVHANGTSDEKTWAHYLLAACVQINARASAPSPDADASGQVQFASPPSPVELVVLQKRASAELAARCNGVKPLAHLVDRQALVDDFRAATASNRSVLGQLEALASSQEDRWNTEQTRQITDSLYSGDPILARAAFFVLLGAMDRDSPGGQDRNAALMTALGTIYAGAPLSNFEQLDACASMGRCGSAWDADYPVPAPNDAVLRLTEKYRAAVASRMDARSIMAIR